MSIETKPLPASTVNRAPDAQGSPAPAGPATSAVAVAAPTTFPNQSAERARAGYGPHGVLTFLEPPSLFQRQRTPEEEKWVRIARDLSDEFARSAPQRYKKKAKPHAELQRLKDAGLTTLLIPPSLGGAGGGWPLVAEVIREIAAGDGSLGVLLVHHYFFISGLVKLPEAERSRAIADYLERKFWVGIVGEPLGPDIIAAPTDRGTFLLNGTKGFCTGSGVADYLNVAARRSDNSQMVCLRIRADLPGVQYHNDWKDALGLPLADSGTVTLENVEVAAADVRSTGPVPRPGEPLPGRSLGRLGAPSGHTLFSNVYLGLAIGALRFAREYIHSTTRPWVVSGVARAADDPLIIYQFGEFWAQVEAATAAGTLAAERFEPLRLIPEPEIDAHARGEAAVAVATFKILATRASVDITSKLFELTGARSTGGRYGFDRFWRDARTYTLHNPVSYKVREVDDYSLNGRLPPETFYT